MDIARKTLSYYFKHIRRYPKLALPAIIILPINSLVSNYLPPLILAVIINRLSTHRYQPGHVFSSFGGELIIYFILALVGSTVLWRLFDFFYWRLEGNVQRSIQKEVFDHLLSQSADFHANQFSGSLVSATNKLSNAYVRITDTTIFQVLPLFIGLFFVSLVMISRSLIYTILLVVFSISYIILSFFVTRKVRHRGALLANAESAQTGALADALTNLMAIKSFATEPSEAKRFSRTTNNTYSKLMGMMLAFQKQQITLGAITGIMSGLSLLVAVISVVSFGANLATAFLIFNYTSTITSQLFQFSNNALRNYNRAFGDANDMIDILQTKPSIKDVDSPKKLAVKEGTIDFVNVGFRHQGENEAIFNNLNLHINKGEKVGLVGQSGSGKTTLTKLLLRFSDIDSGQILIDDQDISQITQSDLRKIISYVPQEPILFHRSIFENIAYGQEEASLSRVKRVAKLAHADEFIEKLPKRYHTLVGERGVKLSGGQRQRIAIARAMMKKAPILVLDEATSALDSESEVLIQDALWQLISGKTTIVIAHRLSTIQKMDRIIVLSDGKIIEDGSHRDLLEQNGVYAKLWGHQSGGFISED